MRKSLVILAVIAALVVIIGIAMPVSAAKPSGDPPSGCGCTEWVNPHGENIPPAGFTTSPGTNPNSGRNPDGFYRVCAPCELSTIYISYVGSDNPKLFGPFHGCLNFKLTEAPGADPMQKKIGSTNGQAGAVQWHFILPADALISIYGPTGDLLSQHVCYVPPPPK